MVSGAGVGPPSPAPAPELPDVVYRLKKAGWNEQLRYSLRSLRNLPHGKVWIAGYKPDWAQVGHVPTPQSGNKWESSNRNLAAACNDPRISESFYLFDDDFHVWRKAETVPVYNRGTINDMLDYYLSQHTADSNYLKRVREARDTLATWGYPDALSYECHVPLPVDKHKMGQVLNRLADTRFRFPGPQYRSFYGNLLNLGGERITDPKVHKPATLVFALPDGVTTSDIEVAVGDPDAVHLLDTPFVSTNRATFVSATGEWLKGLFPEASEYER